MSLMPSCLSTRRELAASTCGLGRTAARSLADLGRRDSRRVASIRQHVRTYAATGVGDMRKLTGRVGEYRLRIGSWRVVFSFGTEPSSGEAAIFILRIDDRRDVYRS